MTEPSFSPWLEASRPAAARIVAALEKRYGWASLLGRDDRGLHCRATPTELSFEENPWADRGFVARVMPAGRVAEWSFNDLDDEASVLDRAIPRLDALLAAGGESRRSYPSLEEEALQASYRHPVDRDPFSADPAAILESLKAIVTAIMGSSPQIVFACAGADFMRVSRLYLSGGRALDQAFIWANAFLDAVAARGDIRQSYYAPASGRQGLEIMDGLPALVPDLVKDALSLLDAGQVEPGEYEVLCSPDIAGLLAHEAFGHGMELDMFVKGRAAGASWMGKPIASPLVTMYEGAAGVESSSSYFFDDEGSLAAKTTVIDKGILTAGISDVLSARALGTSPTGNGRRQGFSPKAYARMTNTYFAPGQDTLADMIASIGKGYLLDRFSSGMEDPRNWGIQMVAIMGREIVDGRLTGKIVSPLVCSGFVPDVLKAISMVSGDFELNGCGMCGKGHKEYVNTASGGPWIKTRMRIG